MRERIEYAIAVALLSLLGNLPLSVSYRMGYAVGRLLDLLLPKLRRVAARNLSAAFPQMTQAEQRGITDGVFRTVGRMLVALARFPSIKRNNVGDWISYQGLEHYQAAKQKGRGVLIATAHLGNWELSAFAHAIMTEPMNVMVRPLDNPLVDQLVEVRRTMSGNRLGVEGAEKQRAGGYFDRSKHHTRGRGLHPLLWHASLRGRWFRQTGVSFASPGHSWVCPVGGSHTPVRFAFSAGSSTEWRSG
jgi:lauroyl/myristoyl acyltransferase